MSDLQHSHTGGCLCGAVRYVVTGDMRDVVNCHCEQCRRTHGSFGAYSAAARAQIQLRNAEGLSWYQSSAHVRRGFCHRCGASLFWDADDRDYLAIAAGSLDAPTGLKTVAHIYTASAGDYYSITDDLPRFDETMRGKS